MFKKRFSDVSVKRWDVAKKVMIFALIFVLVAGYTSLVFGANGMESAVKDTIAGALKTICSLGAAILGVIGVVDIIIAIPNEDQHRRTSGIIMVGGAIALAALASQVTNLMNMGGTSFLPTHTLHA